MTFYDSPLNLITATISMSHFRCEFGRIHKLKIYFPYMISRTYDIQFKNGILFSKLFSLLRKKTQQNNLFKQ